MARSRNAQPARSTSQARATAQGLRRNHGVSTRSVGRAFGIVAAIAVGLGGALVAPLTADPATALVDDSFPLEPPQVYVAQGVPTELYAALQNGTGTVDFVTRGKPVASDSYNATGYRMSDNYIYGMRRGANADRKNDLVKVNSTGKIIATSNITDLPQLSTAMIWNAGTFGEGEFADTLFIRAAVPDTGNSTLGRRMYLVNVVTNELTVLELKKPGSVDLQPMPNTADLIFKDGYIWSFYQPGAGGTASTVVYRIDPHTGETHIFTARHLPKGTFGGQWRYGNGNFGISENGNSAKNSGKVYQISVEGSSTSAPVFKVVSTQSGPASSNNDATASPGLPTDLSIVKTAPATVAPGKEFTFTLTVTNNGEGISSGYTISDEFPADFTNFSVPDGCNFLGNTVTCSGGTLPKGGTKAFLFATTMPEVSAKCITNYATILPNEEDQNQSNNESSATVCLPEPQLKQWKTVKASSDPVRAGSTLDYTLHFENVGDADSSMPVASSDYLAEVLDDAELFGEPVASEGLTASRTDDVITIVGAVEKAADGEDPIIATVTYSVRVKEQKDAGSMLATNFLVPTGQAPPAECDPVDPDYPSCTSTVIVGVLTWHKVDPQGNALAGSEWSLTRTGVDPAGAPTSIEDCIADNVSACTGADRDPAAGGFRVVDLAKGTYELRETKAPAGFKLLPDPIDVTINHTLTELIDIENTQVEVPSLPLTGGLGETAFIIGGLLGLGGAAAAVTWRYMRRQPNSAGARHAL